MDRRLLPTCQRPSEFAPAVLTVAEMGGTANSGRAMRAHPDVVLSLPVLYSELLAMALSGKELKVDASAQSAPQAGMTIFGGLPTESRFRSRGERAIAPASGCSQGEWSCVLQTRLAGFRAVRLIKVRSFRGSTAAWHVGVARTPVRNSVTFA